MSQDMSYDRRASSKTFLSYMRKAEEEFLEDCAKLLKANKAFEKVKVTSGVSAAFLEFEGTDKSDLSFDGYLALIQDGNDVKVSLEVTHVYRGALKFEKTYKIGVLDADTAVRHITERLII